MASPKSAGAFVPTRSRHRDAFVIAAAHRADGWPNMQGGTKETQQWHVCETYGVVPAYIAQQALQAALLANTGSLLVASQRFSWDDRSQRVFVVTKLDNLLGMHYLPANSVVQEITLHGVVVRFITAR